MPSIKWAQVRHDLWWLWVWLTFCVGLGLFGHLAVKLVAWGWRLVP